MLNASLQLFYFGFYVNVINISIVIVNSFLKLIERLTKEREVYSKSRVCYTPNSFKTLNGKYKNSHVFFLLQ